MRFYCLLFAVLTAASITIADVINVPDDFETIQAGIDEAENGDTVLVAPGVYEENISTAGKDTITIGSLILTTDDPDFISRTIIDGGGNDVVVRLRDMDSFGYVLLRGFTIRNGDSDIAGGIEASGPIYAEMVDLIVTENQGGRSAGIGVWSIWDAHFRDVKAIENDGIGFYTSATRTSFENCESSSNAGEGASLGAGTLSVRNTAFLDNSHTGLAIWGIRQIFLDHLTIGGTRQQNDENGNGLRIYQQSGSDFAAELTNSIIYGNEGRSILLREGLENSECTLTVSYSDIEGGQDEIVIEEGGEPEVVWGEGNINADPLFVDVENGDFHLTADSPCIDAGDPESDPDPDGTRADMGAFYFPQFPLVELSLDSLDFGPISAGQEERDLSFFITNSGINDLLIEDIVSDDLNFTTDFEEGLSIEPEDSAEVTVTYAPAEQGLHNSRLTVISNDPDNPEVPIVVTGWAHLGTRFDTDGYTYSVDTDADLVFLSDGEAGLGIYRNVGMGELNLESQLELEYPPALETGVYGQYAVVRVGVRHALIDVSDPTHPDVYRYYGTGEIRTSDFQVFGHYLGRTTEYNSDALLLQSGFYVLDISDPELFGEVINSGFNGWVGAGSSVVISGDRAFVTGSEGNGHYRYGVFIIDVTNPRETELIGFIETEPIPTDIAVSGDYIFLTAGRDSVSVYNVSSPDDPQAVSVIECDSYVSGVRTYYEYLMLLKPLDGVTFYNVVDPENPLELVTFSVLNPTDVKVVNDVAYVTCGEAGVISFDISDYVSAEPQPTLTPLEFSLNPAYPNPFNSSTSITYILPMQSNITLQIFNTRGQLVDVLLDRVMPAGRHSLVWDGSKLANGLYFVKLVSPGYSSTQKTILLK